MANAVVNLATETASVTFAPDGERIAAMSKAVGSIGYRVASEKVVLTIPGLSDPSSAKSVETRVAQIDGVLGATGNPASEQVAVTLVSGAVPSDALRQAVADAGYEAAAVTGTDALDAEVERLARRSELRNLRNRAAFSIVSAAAIMAIMLTPDVERSIGALWTNIAALVLATPVQLWAARQIYASAWSAFLHRTSNMNTLIAIGTSTAYLYSIAVIADGRPCGAERSHLLRYFRRHHRAHPLRQAARSKSESERRRSHPVAHRYAAAHRPRHPRREGAGHPRR